MTLAEKIQHLRKQSNISQEQLAEQLQVSRQAVSKWESNQSTPDLDKIIMLSEYFKVTTDYLLKDNINQNHTPNDATTFHSNNNLISKTVLAISTSVNIISLIIMAMIWYIWQTPIAFFVAIILCILSCTFFEIAKNNLSTEEIRKLRRKYYRINLWIILIPVLLLIFNFISSWHILLKILIIIISIIAYIRMSLHFFNFSWDKY